MNINASRRDLMRLAIATLGLTVTLLSGIALTAWARESISHADPIPLILEKSEGEHRTRRPRDFPMPTSSFTIKVDRQNGGSEKMWLGTEDLPPGAMIPKHRHLGQDEILLIQTGTAHVWLGTQERDAHAGAMVFIPSGTWVSLKNIGSEDISLAFVFSDPGFDKYLRCTSAPTGEASSKVTAAEFNECARQGAFELDRH